LSSNNINEEDNTIGTKWTHSDIEWRLRPPEDTPLIEKMKLQAAAKAIRAECLLREQPVPPVLCPKGGRALLEAYDKKNNKKKQIARFGITTTRGPPAPPMDETIQDIYGVTPPFGGAGIAAIIYMFVEPEYRKLGIGELALEAIAAIQIVQNCDFTVLVADDDGSNKLIEWYERNGFTQAPKLQDIFGSPGGKYGVTMIRPTQVASDIFARCQIVWW
jgi:GNAT superfamily N-acetyltransferase